MGTNKKKIEAIFDKAIHFKNITDRDAYVLRACEDDQKLLARIRALLDHHDVNSFLDSPIFEPDITLDESPLTEGPGTIIGRYKLLEKIGEGGMAAVYMAQQEKPIRRKVALKIIKVGMDTKSVIARFEAERQALAMMDHPNIARVLDAGATETGRPYFVMELVTGVSITEYCDTNNESTSERLKLFIEVCNAVQHAHQKGIIHRDIKPSNVMVTHHDGKPIPKIIDFGIAKATSRRLTEKTLFTRYAHIIGTPAYMSPEQAELSDLDVDTRSDIYSLGVLLYELLTGTTPFSEEELRKAGYIEMERIIREQEPVRPSTKLSTLGKTLTDIAKHRAATPDVLTKAIRGDLDWIVMKSLEKDRTRRYETANGLGEDIRRHLEHEPVLARGPSTTYRLQKFLRRHRSKTIAALALFTISVATVVILSMWNQDRLQLAEAEGFRHRGLLSQAREQYAKADRDTAFKTLKSILSSKYVGPEAQLLYASILVDNHHSDEAVAVLTDLFDKQPEITGSAHSLLARILWESDSPNAERLKEIEEHRQKAEALLPKTSEAYFLRAMTAITIKEQLALLDKALQLDPGHYESRRLRAFTCCASRKYDRLRDDALVMTILRPRDPLGYSLRAITWRELNRYPEAIADFDKALVLAAEGTAEYSDLSMQRCETFLRMGDYEKVTTQAHEGLKLSPENPIFQYYAFSALTAVGNYDKADAVFREIVRRTPTSRNEFREWCLKYVFDTLEAGRLWHPSNQEPSGAAFLPMIEAEKTYRSLSAKARRVTTDGFSPSWSPDGHKLAFSVGVRGYSGIAIFDPVTKETELLIVPGKDAVWSPDGKYIAFVRDCQLLRISKFIALERREQRRLTTDEEVWIMNADGTQPRRLARGGWPSWSQDSMCVYYHSRVGKMLCSISIDGRNAEPKGIMKCSYEYPTLSPDEKRVAYIEGASLKVKDVNSQNMVGEWPVLPSMWGGLAWSPTGQELCVSGDVDSENRRGLWIYSVGKQEPTRVLTGPIATASWSADTTKLALRLGSVYLELWAADLDPNVLAVEALGPGKTVDEHYQEMLAFYNRRIEADYQDAYAYSGRAYCYDYLNEREKAIADMRCWSSILSGSDLPIEMPRNIRRILNGPFGYKIVFSAERPVNEIPLLNVAFGQKGRCRMKTFQIPIVTMSLLGLCLLSGLDTPPACADFIFGEPTNLGPPINTSSDETGPCISFDDREFYFSSFFEAWDIGTFRMAMRETVDDPWGETVSLPPPLKRIFTSCISADGLSLYIDSDQYPGHISVARRTSITEPWGAPENLGPNVNSSANDIGPSISADGLELYITSNRPGGSGNHDIWVSTRAAVSEPWGKAVNLGPRINSPAFDGHTFVTRDGLMLFISSNRPGGYGDFDIWIARRPTRDDDWGAPENLGPAVNTSTGECEPFVSSDGRMLYFSDADVPRPGGAGGLDLWQVPITPIVDFNGDGIVDAADVCIMIEHWLTNYSLCDIGPMPWGDGIVDIEDLIVLSEHLFEDYRLVAHWAMDEDAGNTAVDNTGKYDATLQGGPIWQPYGGKVGGSLQFDGIDDYVSTPFILNPNKGSFSVSAWMKGSAPGQAVISQRDAGRDTGNTWLLADASYGRLMTRLFHPPFPPLVSESVITDDQWHHVGLVYDFITLHRYLYVDGNEVAKDSDYVGGVSSDGGLTIGADKTLDAASFFSGLIDDVRIYNNVLSAEEIATLAR